MVLTKSQWLRKSGIFRCVLVEIDYVELGATKTAYFARGNFRSAGTDTPAYMPYRDLIIGGLQFSQSISEAFTGKSSVDLGDVELVMQPEANALLKKAVAGNQIRIYIGEESWKKSGFYLLATVTSKRVYPSNNSIFVTFRDYSEDLDQLVLTTKTTRDELIPLALGRVFNCKPVLDDAASHRYKFNREASQAVTAVKMNGDVISNSNYTVDLVNSTITFSVMPIGQITIDVDGCNAGGWKSTAAAMILHLFPNAQIDALLATYQLGLYVDSDLTKVALLDKITSSVGAFWLFDEFGVLHVKPFKLPTNTSLLLLSDDHNEQFSRRGRSQFSPVKSVELKYGKNFSPIKSIAGAVYGDAAMADRLQNNYLTKSKINSALTDFKDAISITPVTIISEEVDADTEAQRRLDIGSQPRFISETKQLAAAFEYQLGDEIKLESPDINGDYAIINRKRNDILNETVTLEFWQ